MSTGSWRPIAAGGVAGAVAIVALLDDGRRPLLVPFAIGAAVAALAARRGGRPLAAAGAGLGAAILCILLAIAVVIALAVVALSNQPWLWMRLAALAVAVAGAVLAWRGRDRRAGLYVVGLVLACAAGLVGLHPLGRAIEVRETRGLPPATYPPEPGSDARRTLRVASGAFSLGVHDIAYLNGEGGYATHQLIARWRPPLGLMAEQRQITDLCGSIDRPCPHWFIEYREGPQPRVVEEDALALEPDGDRRVHVRTSIRMRNDPAYAGVSHAWTVGLGPWQWWRGVVWLACIALAVRRFPSAKPAG